MKFQFGKEQVHSSEKMRNHPFLGKIMMAIFGYTNIGNYARFTIFHEIISKLGIKPDSKILDLGCGFGEYSFALSRAFPHAEIHALDIDGSRIKILKSVIEKEKVRNIRPHNFLLDRLFMSNFDFIYSVDVFEHILPEEMPFKAVHKRLKPGGLFLVKIPNLSQRTILPQNLFVEHNKWLDDEHIGQVYDLKGLKERVESEGFEILCARSSDGLLSRAAWEISYLAKKTGLIFHLLFLPLSKFLIHLDRIFFKSENGNAIHVLAQKPQAA